MISIDVKIKNRKISGNQQMPSYDSKKMPSSIFYEISGS